MDSSSVVSQITSNTNYQVQIAVAKKAMDSERAQGDAMVELIKQAAAVGDSLNAGGDGSLDVYA
ncbi:MAG: YjfB family protein [Phycisphaerales bacterium]|nr:YjfB family protein [Phycisphaerales bacterium]